MAANDNTPGKQRVPATGKCPICGKPRVADYRPFCSRRCADVDLDRWLSGAYAIPASEEEPGEADIQAGLGKDGEN